MRNKPNLNDLRKLAFALRDINRVAHRLGHRFGNEVWQIKDQLAEILLLFTPESYIAANWETGRAGGCQALVEVALPKLRQPISFHVWEDGLSKFALDRLGDLCGETRDEYVRRRANALRSQTGLQN